MILTTLLKEIILIPRKFYTLHNISEYDLLMKTGYFENYELVTEQNLYETLCQYPEEIEYWLTLSDDNRSSEKWLISQSKNGKYVVDFFPRNIHEKKAVEFDDIKRACAMYIKRDIEQTRNI